MKAAEQLPDTSVLDGMVMIPEIIRHILLLSNLRDEGAIDYKSGPFPEEYWLSWE